jgi:hypothetical protein
MSAEELLETLRAKPGSLLEDQIAFEKFSCKFKEAFNFPEDVSIDKIDINKPIIYNVTYAYHGTPSFTINLGHYADEQTANKQMIAFEILNHHKDIKIEVSNFVIGEEISCDKLKYPKRPYKSNSQLSFK